jgi:hypothetical protein
MEYSALARKARKGVDCACVPYDIYRIELTLHYARTIQGLSIYEPSQNNKSYMLNI